MFSSDKLGSLQFLTRLAFFCTLTVLNYVHHPTYLMAWSFGAH